MENTSSSSFPQELSSFTPFPTELDSLNESLITTCKKSGLTFPLFLSIVHLINSEQSETLMSVSQHPIQTLSKEIQTLISEIFNTINDQADFISSLHLTEFTLYHDGKSITINPNDEKIDSSIFGAGTLIIS